MSSIVEFLMDNPELDTSYTSNFAVIKLEDVDIEYVTSIAMQFTTNFLRAFHQKVIDSDNEVWRKAFYDEVDFLADQLCWSLGKSTKKRDPRAEPPDYGTEDDRIVSNFKQNMRYLKREYECQYDLLS